MSGRNDAAFLNYFNPRLPHFAGEGPVYHGAYGHRLRKSLGFDQLERAYKVLSANPDSRQVVLQVWDARADLPREDGVPQAEDIPCNISALLKVRDGKLEWTQIMRSNDLILGLPHNFVQFTSLQEVLAGWLGLELGAYHHLADSLHLYEKDAPISNRIEPRSLPPNSESISLPKAASERAFSQLITLGECVSSSEMGNEKIVSAFRDLDLNPAFRSWGALLIADALRRREAFSSMELVMRDCSNRCLATMFERWLFRHRAASR